MKINQIELERYGKYKNQQLNFKEGLNIVYGQNEAGKSTLFNALMTLLYGFKPATKEAHPYLGWGENYLLLTASFEDEEGLYRVERKLSNSPIGRLYKGDKEIKINNRPLDAVAHLSKQTFESIYALTLYDMIKLSEAPWSEVEDRLILHYGLETFRSPRDIIATIEEEMRKIYNPRGQVKNTQIKKLEINIKALMEKKRDIKEHQSQVLDIEKSLNELDGRLNEKEENIVVLTEQVEWWEQYGDLMTLFNQFQSLEKQLELLADTYGNIPVEIEGFQTYKSRIEELEKEIHQLNLKKENLEKEINGLTEAEEVCLKQETQLETLIKIAGDNNHKTDLLEKEKSILEDKKSHLERHLFDIVKKPREDQIKDLGQINLLSLEGKFNDVSKLKKELQAMQKELVVLNPKNSLKDKSMGIILTLIGSFIFGSGNYLNQLIINYLGIALISLGLFKVFINNGQSPKKDKEIYEKKYAFDEAKLKVLADEIQSEIAFISLDKERIIENGSRVYQVLSQGRDMANDYLRACDGYKKAKEKIDLTTKRLQSQLAMLFQKELFLADIVDLLQNAKNKGEKNREVLREIKGLNKLSENLEGQIQGLKNKKALAENYLKNKGQGSLKKGFEDLKQLDVLKGRLDFVQVEIETLDPTGVMREELIKKGSSLLGEKDLIAHRKLSLSKEKEVVEELKILRQKYKSDLEHLHSKTDLFDVESQLLFFQEKLEELKITYDELQILKAVVEGFDQSYREAHQPDILKKTGLYFKQFSKGKYAKIYNDEVFGKTTLLIRENDEDHVVEEVLSQGSKDQLYLSLRLALAQELDSHKDRLPLFLDEVFVNWDMERLDQGIELLKELANERQIILFTCHDWLAKKISENAKTHLVLLNT